jgi:hypothetical protein
MKRHPFSIFVILAVLGLGWVIGSPVASAQPRTIIDATVGHVITRGLGNGKNFSLATCTSSAPSTVGCDIWTNKPPRDAVRLWCLTPTSSGVTVTVTYNANVPRAAIPPTVLTVTCRSAKVPNVATPGTELTNVLSKAPYSVTGCTTNVFGTTCTYTGGTITKVCSLAATANTLPITVTATVTLAGPTAINGKTIDVYFTCT